LRVNSQETARTYVDAQISDASLRESDLLAFQIAIERGKPGAVMCAYNRLNSVSSCSNDYLLNRVLKRDWGFKGFVMSDWGAVPDLTAALSGLDQQSGSQLDKELYFADRLKTVAERDRRYAARLRDMNRRILYAVYANGLDRSPGTAGPLNSASNLALAGEAAREGIVLLRNERNALTLTGSARSIVLIGGYANAGVLSGGGSSQVHMDNGPAVLVPLGGEGPFANATGEGYHRSSPMKAIKAKVPKAQVTYRRGNYISEAVKAARRSDVAIVFATQWTTEGFDVPDLSLPGNQDAFIAAVADANPNTIVVLQTGGGGSDALAQQDSGGDRGLVPWGTWRRGNRIGAVRRNESEWPSANDFSREL
jgi:beta-glucosidase